MRAKYAGYIEHESLQAERLKRDESKKIPDNFDYDAIRGLRFEAREKLKRILPDTLRRAASIPGVNPADLSLLSLALKKASYKGWKANFFGATDPFEGCRSAKILSGRAFDCCKKVTFARENAIMSSWKGLYFCLKVTESTIWDAEIEGKKCLSWSKKVHLK